jgi:hypothetical protein
MELAHMFNVFNFLFFFALLILHRNGASLFFDVSIMLFSCELGSPNQGKRCFELVASTLLQQASLERLRTSTGKYPGVGSSSTQFFSRMSPEAPKGEISAYNPGKCGIGPIRCRPKECQVSQKIQATRGVVIIIA